jgi:hypothetical protein
MCNRELPEKEAQVVFSYQEHEWEADLSGNKLWKKASLQNRKGIAA